MTATDVACRALVLQIACHAVNACPDRVSARSRVAESLARIARQVRAARGFLGQDVRLVVLPGYYLTGNPVAESIPEWADKAALEPDGPEYKALARIAQGTPRRASWRGGEVLLHSTSGIGSPRPTSKDIAQRARALENPAYVVSANSGGCVDADLPRNSAEGMSKIVDYLGEVPSARSKPFRTHSAQRHRAACGPRAGMMLHRNVIHECLEESGACAESWWA